MFDINEYEKIVNEHGENLYNYCVYKANNDISVAEETYNDVLKVLYQKWDSLERGNDIRAYLYRVADMCTKHNLGERQKYYNSNISLEAAHESGALAHLDHRDKYFELDDDTIEKYAALAASRLPEKYRDIFTYRFIEKRTIAETASLAGIPAATCRVRLKKAERLARKEIKKIFVNFK